MRLRCIGTYISENKTFSPQGKLWKKPPPRQPAPAAGTARGHNLQKTAFIEAANRVLGEFYRPTCAIVISVSPHKEHAQTR